MSTRYDISEDMLRDIARDLNDGAHWPALGRQYGMAPATLKRAYQRKSREIYGHGGRCTEYCAHDGCGDLIEWRLRRWVHVDPGHDHDATRPTAISDEERYGR